MIDYIIKEYQKNLRVIGLSFVFLFASSLFCLPLLKIYSLHTSYFDLGIFDNVSFRISIMGEWQAAFSAHAHWFSLLFSWIYGAIPLVAGPYALVSAQAVLLLYPTFFFYRYFGLFISFVYVIYYPLWVNAFFDFHFDHLAVPLLIGYYWALIRRKAGWASAYASLLIFVKEPFALQTAGCGVLMLWAAFRSESIWERPLNKSQRCNFVIGSVWLILLGLGYFYFAMNFLLPYFAPVNWEGALVGDAFGWLGRGMGGILYTILTKPVMLLSDIINTPGKILYLIVVFGMLAFIPLLHPVFLIPGLPLLAIAMLSRLPNYYDYNTHYTVGLIVPVMFSFAYGIRRMERIWFFFVTCIFRCFQNFKFIFLTERCEIKTFKKSIKTMASSGIDASLGGFKAQRFILYHLILCWILLGHVILSPSPISRLFWLDKIWSYNWQAYTPRGRDAIIKNAIEEFIPSDSAVFVTTQNTLNYSNLAHRRIYTSFPLGIYEPIKVIDYTNLTLQGFVSYVKTGEKPLPVTRDIYAEYVVLDLMRPWFLVDKGCEWIYNSCRNLLVYENFLSYVDYTRSRYDSVYEYDGFVIFRRRSL